MKFDPFQHFATSIPTQHDLHTPKKPWENLLPFLYPSGVTLLVVLIASQKKTETTTSINRYLLTSIATTLRPHPDRSWGKLGKLRSRRPKSKGDGTPTPKPPRARGRRLGSSEKSRKRSRCGFCSKTSKNALSMSSVVFKK